MGIWLYRHVNFDYSGNCNGASYRTRECIQLRAMIIQTTNFNGAITRSTINAIMRADLKEDSIASSRKDNAFGSANVGCNQNFTRSNGFRRPWLDDAARGEVPSRHFRRMTHWIARQLDDMRGKEEFYARTGRQVTGREVSERDRGQPANTGLITFRAPQWGWNRRLDVARGTRASDSRLLPSSLHYRWSSMLQEPGLPVLSRRKMRRIYRCNDFDATLLPGLSAIKRSRGDRSAD